MNQKQKVWMGVGVIALIVLVGAYLVGVGNTGTTTTDSEVIRLGFIGPLSGDAASYGDPLQQVVEIAVDEINSAGGVSGKNLEVIFEDGTCDAKGGTNAAQKLINVDGVNVILGGLCSGETLGAAPVAEENQIILFSAASGSPDITTAGDYVFRNFPSDATSGSKVALAALDNGHSRISIISEQTDYAQAVKGVFRSTFEENGGEVLVDEAFLSDSNDFRGALTKIKDSDPDGVYLVTQTPAKYGLVLKQLNEIGIDKQIYTNEFASAEDILGEYSSEIEGAIFAEPKFDDTTPEAQELLNKIQNRFGEVSGALPPVYFATTYDAVYILSDMVGECGETDTDCMKEYLYGVEDRFGIAGTLTIDSNGDAEFEYVLKTIDEGAVVEVN